MWKMRDCVCVCVCVCERERERERGQDKEKNEEETRALKERTGSLCLETKNSLFDKTHFCRQSSLLPTCDMCFTKV